MKTKKHGTAVPQKAKAQHQPITSFNRAEKIQAEFLSVIDAETKTGVSRWTWRQWAYSGKVASVKISTRLLIPVAEIDRILSEATRPAKAS